MKKARSAGAAGRALSKRFLLLALVALLPAASASYVSVEPTGHAFGESLAVSGVGNAEARCRTELCVAASGTGEARAKCDARTLLCTSVSGLGASQVECEASPCVAVSGTGRAKADCRSPSVLCQRLALGPSRLCAGGAVCATLDSRPGAQGCHGGTCAEVQTFEDAEGTAAVSAFGASRSDTLAVSGTNAAAGTRGTCSPPPHSTSVCPGSVAVSGLGSAESDRHCDATFCTGRLAASGTGDADGYFAVSLAGHARGAVAVEPGRQLRALQTDGPLPERMVPALP